MKQTDSINLFIINDDPMLMQALEDEVVNVFAFYNVSVTQFATAEECSSFMKNKFSPDIVILDHQLSNSAIGSFAMVDLIKTINRGAETIMLTGDESAEMSTRALEHGVHDYIIKNDFLFKKIRITMLQCIKVVQLRKNMKKQVNLGMLSLAVIFSMFTVVSSVHYYAPANSDLLKPQTQNTHTNNVINRQAQTSLHTGDGLVGITTAN